MGSLVNLFIIRTVNSGGNYELSSLISYSFKKKLEKPEFSKILGKLTEERDKDQQTTSDSRRSMYCLGKRKELKISGLFFQRDLIRRASGRYWAIPYSSRDDDFAFKSIPSRIRVSSLKKMQRVCHKLFSQKKD